MIRVHYGLRVLSRAALAVALAAPLRVAHAHAHLARSSPARGARLLVVPRELRLTFSEAPELAASRVLLLGPDGQAVSLEPLRIDSARTLVAAVRGALTAGDYTIEWSTAGSD